jgi:hypothetical protein
LFDVVLDSSTTIGQHTVSGSSMNLYAHLVFTQRIGNIAMDLTNASADVDGRIS